MDKELKPLRDQIDAIDKQILELLSKRGKVAQQVGTVKSKFGAPIYRPERESQILERAAKRNEGPLSDTALQNIFREIMSSCRALEKRISVAFLGPTGTYSEQACYQQFGHSIDTQACPTLDEVFRIVEAGGADFGVVPIENSTEGAINRTLDLLLRSPLLISGELSIPIHHNLMTKDGGTNKITIICAHSQALAQCQSWLNQNFPNITRQAVSSNAEAAKMAAENPNIAAIAGETAGETYNLKITHAYIQDDPHNRTRFAVIGHYQPTPSGNDQTSVVLSVKNEAGAVYRMLEPLARHGVSMTRFESRPARLGSWEYNFFIDMQGHIKDEKVAKAVSELKEHAAFFKLLGAYPFCL